MLTIWAITFDWLIQIERMSPFWKLHFQGFPTSPGTPELDPYFERYSRLKMRLLQALNAGKVKSLRLPQVNVAAFGREPLHISHVFQVSTAAPRVYKSLEES